MPDVRAVPVTEALELERDVEDRAGDAVDVRELRAQPRLPPQHHTPIIRVGVHAYVNDPWLGRGWDGRCQVEPLGREPSRRLPFACNGRFPGLEIEEPRFLVFTTGQVGSGHGQRRACQCPAPRGFGRASSVQRSFTPIFHHLERRRVAARGNPAGAFPPWRDSRGWKTMKSY